MIRLTQFRTIRAAVLRRLPKPGAEAGQTVRKVPGERSGSSDQGKGSRITNANPSARRPRGDGERPRGAPVVPPAERAPPPAQKSAVRSVARGHARPTRGAAAWVKEKARPRSARSEEVVLTEEVARSEEMAAAGLSVTVTHSKDKHDLQVTPQEGNSESTVQDLAQVVEEATGIPLPFQKLIFKGKSLKEMEMPLSALGIQNGCRLMLIGKKNSPEEEAELKKLQGLEKSVEKIADQLEELK